MINRYKWSAKVVHMLCFFKSWDLGLRVRVRESKGLIKDHLIFKHLMDQFS